MNKSINNIDSIQSQNPNIGDTSGDADTKLFTKNQVNKIVEERLKKEKIKFGALKDLKDAVMNLYERGYFDKYKDENGKNLSLSGMVNIVLEEIKELGKPESAENIQGIENPNGLNADNALAQARQNPAFANTPTPNDSSKPPEWSTNSKIFELFAQNKNLPMDEILNEYLKFVVQVQQAQTNQPGIKNIQTDETGMAGSPYHNYGRQNSYIPYGVPNNLPNNTEQNMGTQNTNRIRSEYNSISPAQSHRSADNLTLTERQKELARAGGMTYKEYYEFINSIPTKKLKK